MHASVKLIWSVTGASTHYMNGNAPQNSLKCQRSVVKCRHQDDLGAKEPAAAPTLLGP